MKKYFLMAIAVFATITFVSCNKNNPSAPEESAKVVVNPHSLELIIGDSQRIRASLNPAKSGVSITFTSDDPQVATVTKAGDVTGVAVGTANIIASVEGATPDTCVVTVMDPYDAFNWGGFILAKKGNTVGDPYMLSTYKVQNYEGVFYAYSSDVEFVNGEGLVGAGYTAVVDALVGIIAEGEYSGQYITWELNFDNSYPQDSVGVSKEGSLTNAAEWYSYLMDEDYTGDGSFTGSPIHYWDWSAGEDTSNDVDFVGFIKNGWIGDYSNGFFYQTNVVWFDLNQGLYGLKMEQNTEGKWQFVQPYEFTDRIEKYYANYPPAGATRAKGIPMHFVDAEKDVKVAASLQKKMEHITTRRMSK